MFAVLKEWASASGIADKESKAKGDHVLLPNGDARETQAEAKKEDGRPLPVRGERKVSIVKESDSKGYQPLSQNKGRPLPIRPPSIDQPSSTAERRLPVRPDGGLSSEKYERLSFCRAPTRRQLILYVAFLIGVALAAFIFYPKKPGWEVLDLTFETFDIPILDGGVQSIVSWNYLGNKSAVKIVLTTSVRASNPNIIGATTDPGTYEIFYKKKIIGNASTVPLVVPPYGSIVIHPKVLVDGVPVELGMEMLDDMQNNHMQLTVHVKGKVIAHVGFMKVQTTILCTLVTDASELPKRTRFTRRKCVYAYGLPGEKPGYYSE
eukprot:TRINITY_DN6646_c0_g1_i1.p1 TRINITY_DN6646_c0_g1~~TRINITY_DN6646_c0_g1_i1.p1  ORF type:complete len:321 (+),score=51.95 TRINITY_DN6646_c0_g1_i1:95-1057(+)